MKEMTFQQFRHDAKFDYDSLKSFYPKCNNYHAQQIITIKLPKF